MMRDLAGLIVIAVLIGSMVAGAYLAPRWGFSRSAGIAASWFFGPIGLGFLWLSRTKG